MKMALKWFGKERAGAGEAGRVAELKEKALGSQLLGRRDTRLTASKYVALALAASIAVGTGFNLVKRHHEQTLARQAAVQMMEEAEHRNRAEQLKKAGLSGERADYWAGIMKRNQEFCKKFGHPSIQPFTPEEIVELEKMLRESARPPHWMGTVPDARIIHSVLMVLKALNEHARTPRDYEYESRSLDHAFNYLAIGKDRLMAWDMMALHKYILGHKHEPVFRSTLLKLKKYADLGLYPFD